MRGKRKSETWKELTEENVLCSTAAKWQSTPRIGILMLANYVCLHDKMFRQKYLLWTRASGPEDKNKIDKKKLQEVESSQTIFCSINILWESTESFFVINFTENQSEIRKLRINKSGRTVSGDFEWLWSIRWRINHFPTLNSLCLPEKSHKFTFVSLRTLPDMLWCCLMYCIHIHM